MLTDEQIAEGWIAHDGGPCPVNEQARVTVMFRSGAQDTAIARAWWWGRGNKPRTYEIIAYQKELPDAR